jgi:NAD-dependent deacetylase
VNTIPNPAFDAVLERLVRARRVAAFTGAGVSAESGVATFRDQGGLWENHSIEEVATPEGFARNPKLVWEFYEARRGALARVRPNPGHEAIARLAQLVEEITVITQNVDGLHQRAGSPRVLEIHGSLRRAKCAEACGSILDPFEHPAPSIPPKCACGALLRPDVVWFGEMLPTDVWARAEDAANASEVVLAVGTSGVVWPAARIPLEARRRGAFVIEVNPEPTELTGLVDVALRGPSGTILPRLVDALAEARGGWRAQREGGRAERSSEAPAS